MTRSVLALVALSTIAVGCKKKPPPPFEGTCAVSQIQTVSGQEVRATLTLTPKAAGGATRPDGSLLLQVFEMGGSPTLKCTPSAKLSEASYRGDLEATVAMHFSDNCLGDPAPGKFVAVRSFFTVEAASTAAMECPTSGTVPAAWGGQDKTAAEQAALVASAPPQTANAKPAVVDARPVVRVDMKDGLSFPDGKVHEAATPIVVYARVTAEYVTAGALTPKAKTALLAKMYGGPDWEKGNADGSRYVVRSFRSRVLTAAEIAAPLWAKDAEAATTWFYETTSDGSFDERGPSFGPPTAGKPPGHLDER